MFDIRWKEIYFCCILTQLLLCLESLLLTRKYLYPTGFLCCGFHLDQPPAFWASVFAFFKKKSVWRAFLSDRCFSNIKLGLSLYKRFDRCLKGRISDSFCSRAPFSTLLSDPWCPFKDLKVKGHQPSQSKYIWLMFSIFWLYTEIFFCTALWYL